MNIAPRFRTEARNKKSQKTVGEEWKKIQEKLTENPLKSTESSRRYTEHS